MLRACPSSEWSICLGNDRCTFASVPTASCWPGWITIIRSAFGTWKTGARSRSWGRRLVFGWHNLAFYPDSDHLTFGTAREMVETWDTRHGAEGVQLWARRVIRLPARTAGGWRPTADPSTVTLWSSQTGSQVFSLPPESGPIWSLALSPDGERLAVGLADGGLAIWNVPKIQARTRPDRPGVACGCPAAAGAGAPAFRARDARGAEAPDQCNTRTWESAWRRWAG